MNEDLGHKKLKNKIAKILERCGQEFKVDSEIHLDIFGRGEDDISFDVGALIKGKNGDYLIIIECKNRKRIEKIKNFLSGWEKNIEYILKNKIKVISSSKNKFKDKDFKNLKNIRLGFAFTERLNNQSTRIEIEKKDMVFWDHHAVKYFDKTSLALEEWTKYEIFREFKIFLDIQEDSHSEEAIQIKQKNKNEMFLLGIHPGLLLKIAYVSRRTSNKPSAYQRVINKDRIKKIANYLSSKNILLPNSIIIAFDKDDDIQKKLKYEKGRLSFPIKYCCALIIDGQHRVFGFSKTKYKKWRFAKNDEFKIPIVAFKNLPERLQNKVFVDINYYQKKIDPTLFCDLATLTKDITNELTWPSLLVSELNKNKPWKNLVKISEFDTKRAITLSSFARYALLEILLGYNELSDDYNGSLFNYAPFNKNLSFDCKENQKAFKKQMSLLKYFFSAIENKTYNNNGEENVWGNFKKYSLTKTTGTNAFLLVLSRILEKYPNGKINFNEYLKPIKDIDFKAEKIASYGGGWRGFKKLANHIIWVLNKKNGDSLKYFRKRKKKQK